MECIFCKIANQTIPAEILYQDELVMAFSDIRPQAPIHKLIIPRHHIATLNDLQVADAALAGHLFLTATRLARELGINDAGYRLVFNCNNQGGQEVYHIHLHLLGGRTMQWPPG